MANPTLDTLDPNIASSNRFTEDEVNKLSGTRTTISVVHEPREVDYQWDGNTKLPEGQSIKQWVVTLETAPIGTRQIPVKQNFKLKQNVQTGAFGPNKHEKSDTYKLFKSLIVNDFRECKGKEIVLVKKIKLSGKADLVFAL